MNRVSQTRCTQCKKTVELNDNDLMSIDDFTDRVLVPLMTEEVERKNVKTLPNDSSAPSKKFTPHEQSMDKATPQAGRFYSKC